MGLIIDSFSGAGRVLIGCEQSGVAPWRTFNRLWNTLHTKPGETWADNPFVVALTFDVIRGNVDEARGIEAEARAKLKESSHG